jgi:predicted metal-dependent peptidase
VFATEADAVLAAYDSRVAVVYHDTEVQKVQAWQSRDGPLVLEPVGGGGTSHACVFDWIEKSGLSPACVVCLTDLDTEFPPVVPAVPVLWAVPGPAPADPPFGRVVALSL